MAIHPFTCGASTVVKKSIALPMTLSHCLTQNLTQGFAQLAVVRISWWVLLLRKLAGVMGHGSLQFAIAPRSFPRGGSYFPHASLKRADLQGLIASWGEVL
jgi:hypothetical protein